MATLSHPDDLLYKRQRIYSVTAFPQSELFRVITWLNRGGSPDDLGEFLSDAGL
ncbi:hypothetical protein YPPY94_4727, partial [Yersinia pestis PY-94]